METRRKIIADPGWRGARRISFAGFVFAAAPRPGAAADSALQMAWWGSMSSIYYPAGERDGEVVEHVEAQLRLFRDANPEALLLDLGGFAGPLATRESIYELPPLPFYKEIGVEAVHATGGDWLTLLPANLLLQAPPFRPVSLLSPWRMMTGETPRAVDAEKIVKTAGGREVILTALSRFRAIPQARTMEDLVDEGAASEAKARERIQRLRAQKPGALSVLLADMEFDEARRLAQIWSSDVDLVLVNREREPVRAERPAEGGAWVIGRGAPGRLVSAVFSLDAQGRVEDVRITEVELVPVIVRKGGFWSRLGLARAPEPVRRVSKAPPPPKIGLNLRDPIKYLVEMGYDNASVTKVVCGGIPERLREKIGNENVVAFEARAEGRLIGRLYRLRHELPEPNGNYGINLLFDNQGILVNITAAHQSTFGLRGVSMAELVKNWKGKAPQDLVVPAEWSQGIEEELEILVEDIRLAEEIDRACR